MPVLSGTLKPIRLPKDNSWLKRLWRSLGWLRAAPPPLADWLAQRPSLREALVWERPPAPNTGPFPTVVAWDAWNAEERDRLKQAFEAAWNGKLSTASEPFQNIVPPPVHEFPRTVISRADGAAQYFETAGACLAFEARLPSGSPRSLANQDLETRRHVLDSRSLFAFNGTWNGYILKERFLPARPGYVLQWLASLSIPESATVRDIVAAIVGYCGNFYHFAGPANAGTYEAHWHYLGGTPMVRMIEKTVPKPIPDNMSPNPEPRHYTAGCFGTTSFLEHALRVLNIRVAWVVVEGHTLPHFTQIGLYLSHGDDPYPLKLHPQVSPDALLIDQVQFDAWFGPGVPPQTREANIGRRAQELFGG